MPIYIKYAALNGDVTESTHSQWIEVNSFQWGVGRGIASPTGGSSDRESSAPSVSEAVVTKPTDVATIKLIDLVATANRKTRCLSPGEAFQCDTLAGQ